MVPCIQQPGIGGEVVPHQDNSFLYTDPPTCTGLWLALEDATVSNGCLWAIPGSQKSSFLALVMGMPETWDWFVLTLVFLSDGLVRKFIRNEDGVTFDRPSPAYERKDFVPIEVKAGSLVLIHGDLIHQRLAGMFFQLPDYKMSSIIGKLKFLSCFPCADSSFENTSSKSRHAYSIHVVDTDGCRWAEWNW